MKDMNFEEFKKFLLEKTTERFNKTKKCKKYYRALFESKYEWEITDEDIKNVKFELKDDIIYFNYETETKKILKANNLLKVYLKSGFIEIPFKIQIEMNGILEFIKYFESVSKQYKFTCFRTLNWLRKELLGEEEYQKLFGKKKEEIPIHYDAFGIELKEGDYIAFPSINTTQNDIDFGIIKRFTKKMVIAETHKSWTREVRVEPYKIIKLLFNPTKINSEKFEEMGNCIKNNFPELFI